MHKPVHWTNLNPLWMLDEMKKLQFMFPFKTLEDYMKRAGITNGYQSKPCLDPADPECPETAPNKKSQQVSKQASKQPGNQASNPTNAPCLRDCSTSGAVCRPIKVKVLACNCWYTGSPGAFRGVVFWYRQIRIKLRKKDARNSRCKLAWQKEKKKRKKKKRRRVPWNVRVFLRSFLLFIFLSFFFFFLICLFRLLAPRCISVLVLPFSFCFSFSFSSFFLAYDYHVLLA